MTQALFNTDKQLWGNFHATCKDMPNGGAAIQVTDDGTVHNGMSVLARFESKHKAVKTLIAAGFHGTHYGFKA